MSIVIDKGEVTIRTGEKRLIDAVEDLTQMRNALYDLLGAEDTTRPAETTYYGLMLLRMTEPSYEQWKSALKTPPNN